MKGHTVPQPGVAGPNVRYKDFTLDRPAIKFSIAGQNFDAVPALSAGLLQDMVEVVNGLGDEVTLETVKEVLPRIGKVFNAVLEDESATRFAEIFNKLDLQMQVMPLLVWLLEAYGLRPTQLSSDSTTQSATETDGITSALGA